MALQQGNQARSYERSDRFASRQRGIACVLFALTLAPAGFAQLPGQTGNIIAVSGEWVRVTGLHKGTVKLGDPVIVGDQIQARQPASKSSIDIALSSGAAIHRSCWELEAAGCQAPITIDDDPGVQPTYKRIMTAVMALFSSEVPHQVITSARGVEGPEESVLALDVKGLDLSPALNRVSNGEYLADLAVERNGKFSLEAVRLPLSVPNAKLLNAKPGELKPGIYRLTILSAKQEEPVGVPVVVLIVRAEDYETRSANFARVREMTSHWGKGTPVSTIHYFLGVCLRALSSDQTEQR